MQTLITANYVSSTSPYLPLSLFTTPPFWFISNSCCGVGAPTEFLGATGPFPPSLPQQVPIG